MPLKITMRINAGVLAQGSLSEDSDSARVSSSSGSFRWAGLLPFRLDLLTWRKQKEKHASTVGGTQRMLLCFYNQSRQLENGDFAAVRGAVGRSGTWPGVFGAFRVSVVRALV